MKYLFLILYFFLAASISCYKSSDNNNSISSKEEILSPPLEEKKYISASEDFLNNLLQNTTSIEGTMYNNAASFSLFDKNSITGFIKDIDIQSPSKLSKEAIGHFVFIQNGEVLYMTNVYHSVNEYYIVFETEKEPFYNLIKGKAKAMFTTVQVKPK